MQPKTKFEGLNSHIVGPENDANDHGEVSGKNSKSKVPMLARYVKWHHAPNQIIGVKSDGTMTRDKLEGTCLLTKFEPRSVKDDLNSESWIEAMNEEIEQMERNMTQTLVPILKEIGRAHV